MKLLLLLLPLLTPAKTKDPYPHCGKRMELYEKAMAETGKKIQSCKQDSDCELLFIGGGLSGCDLGEAVAPKVMGKKYFKKLDRLREAAENACPPDDGYKVHCMAEPASEAKCVNKICEAH